MENDENLLNEIIARLEVQFPGLVEQIRAITSQRLAVLLSKGIVEQQANSGNTTTQLE